MRSDVEEMRTFLDFEKPIAELEGKIAELRHLSSTSDLNIADEVGRLQGKLDALLKQTYSRLTAWQKAQVARHVDRPHTLDYIPRLVDGLHAARRRPRLRRGRGDDRRHRPAARARLRRPRPGEGRRHRQRA